MDLFLIKKRIKINELIRLNLNKKMIVIGHRKEQLIAELIPDKCLACGAILPFF